MGGKKPWDENQPLEIERFQHWQSIMAPGSHGFWIGSLRVAAARWFGAHPGYIKSPTIIREWGKAGTERFFQVSKHPRFGGCFFQIKKLCFSSSSNFTIPAQVYFIYDSNSIYFCSLPLNVWFIYHYLPTKLCSWRGGIIYVRKETSPPLSVWVWATKFSLIPNHSNLAPIHLSSNIRGIHVFQTRWGSSDTNLSTNMLLLFFIFILNRNRNKNMKHPSCCFFLLPWFWLFVKTCSRLLFHHSWVTSHPSGCGATRDGW